MKAVICFALLAVASATSVDPKDSPVKEVIPQARQLVYLQGAQQPAYVSRAAALYPGAYQAPIYQQPQYEAYRFSQPQYAQYKAPALISRTSTPVLSAVPAPAAAPLVAAPKPLLKQYQVNEPAPQWAILRSISDNNFDGAYQYEYETENGISHSASAVVKQLSPKEQAQVVQGQYSYISPEGQVITTRYTADENGFIAQGDHLPVAPLEPELPPLIAKSLAYIRSLPPQPENQQ